MGGQEEQTSGGWEHVGRVFWRPITCRVCAGLFISRCCYGNEPSSSPNSGPTRACTRSIQLRSNQVVGPVQGTGGAPEVAEEAFHETCVANDCASCHPREDARPNYITETQKNITWARVESIIVIFRSSSVLTNATGHVQLLCFEEMGGTHHTSNRHLHHNLTASAPPWV